MEALALARRSHIMVNRETLRKFLKESNRIEGIGRPPNKRELDTFDQFLALETLTIEALEDLVKAFQPGACLRELPGLNVTIGNHTPPRGGPRIPAALQQILDGANAGEDPYKIHHEYETLHPFMDGNGRSGRAIWAWQMLRKAGDGALDYGFLHIWYYQSLADKRRIEGSFIP